MASVIKAGNATDGVQVTSDNTGILELKTGTGAGTTAVTVDTSQNVGIGTSSPSYKLDVAGSTRIQTSSGYNFFFQTSGTTARINYLNDAFSVNISAAYRATDFTWQKSDGSDVLKLDSSGNLGLGVTPSAWSGVGAALQVGTSAAIIGNNANSSSFISNAYFDGTNYRYIGTGFAQRLALTSGAYAFQTAASGTAGNAISFTQAMTLDASGNLGVGTSSPVSASGFIILTLNGSTSGALYLQNNGTNRFRALSDTASAYLYAMSGTTLILGSGDTERIRIDTSGYTQFSSNLVMPYQGAPTSKAAAATLTGAELITGILNTTGTTYTITLPTGTNIEGALTWSANNVCLDWFVINTASGTITIGANGNTTLGSLTIATGTSAQFRIRRTAANTFTVYRL